MKKLMTLMGALLLACFLGLSNTAVAQKSRCEKDDNKPDRSAKDQKDSGSKDKSKDNAKDNSKDNSKDKGDPFGRGFGAIRW
jgi:hypothetical protein